MTMKISKAVVFFSTCSSMTRGHRRINQLVRQAAILAGAESVSPLPVTAASDLSSIVATLLDAGCHRVLVIIDYPDVPQSLEFFELISNWRNLSDGRVSTLQLAMKCSQYYRDLFTAFETPPPPYNAVVSIEPGACRHVQEHREKPAICRDADFKIAPLVSEMPPLTEGERDVWIEATRRIARPILWLRSGMPEEDERTRHWLNDSLPGQIVNSGVLQGRADERHVSAGPIVRLSQLAEDIICAPGYSLFWELFALGVSNQVRQWITYPRPVEDIPGRLRLLEKPELLAGSTPNSLLTNPQSGVLALSRIIASMLEH